MQGPKPSAQQYVLLLQATGIQAGMRVLDLGTGLGHVAHLAGELVGATGALVGLDQSPQRANAVILPPTVVGAWARA